VEAAAGLLRPHVRRPEARRHAVDSLRGLIAEGGAKERPAPGRGAGYVPRAGSSGCGTGTPGTPTRPATRRASRSRAALGRSGPCAVHPPGLGRRPRRGALRGHPREVTPAPSRTAPGSGRPAAGVTGDWEVRQRREAPAGPGGARPGRRPGNDSAATKAPRGRAAPRGPDPAAARRQPERVDERAYSRGLAPGATALTAIVRAAGARWTSDDTFKRAKGQVGLGHDEVRSRQG